MRLKIIKLALLQYGKKYVWSKRGPTEFDCSGLPWFLYNELFGVDINYMGIGQSSTTKQMTGYLGKLKLINEKEFLVFKKQFIVNQVSEGDLLFFHRQAMYESQPTRANKYPGHVGVSLGGSKFIHASYPRKSVLISDFEHNQYWYEALVGSKDIVSDLILKK